MENSRKKYVLGPYVFLFYFLCSSNNPTSISFWEWLESLKIIHLKACLTSLPWDDNSADSFECFAFCEECGDLICICVYVCFQAWGSHVSAGACGDFRLMLDFSWIVSYLIWCGRVSGWTQSVSFWFVWLASLFLSPLSLPPRSWDYMWLPHALSFFVGVGVQTWVPTLIWETLYSLSHIPCPPLTILMLPTPPSWGTLLF